MINRHKTKVLISASIILSLLILAGAASVNYTSTEEKYSNPVLVETIKPKAHKGIVTPFVVEFGIGDPTVISHDGKYYLYPTGDQYSYYVYISSDLINWKKGPKVFTSAESGAWAPDVFYNPDDKKFYLYYTVNRKIGVAVADRPDGTFKDLNPLIDNAIDAHMFLDNGRYYLYYATYPGFRIYVQPMESPVKKKEEPIEIISPTKAWEKKRAAITEAPWMLKHNDTYYLLYSGGGADSQDYAIGYATSKHPTGPFTKYKANPIIKKGAGIFGPGHASVTKDGKGKMWMVYHQQNDETIGWNRIICINPLWFDDNGVLHGKASRAIAQTAPVVEK
ncbi:MAG TPA: hypothetical protein ENH40_02350 [Nitrospirae bacterium]|nr:hypothetical protein [Nitrospirota bacterium]